MAGVTGWFMVLRRQAFAGHTLSVIAFPGAAAAGWAGVPLALGYFGFCGAGALVLAAIAGTRRSLGAESAAIGSLQALALALGLVVLYAWRTARQRDLVVGASVLVLTILAAGLGHP